MQKELRQRKDNRLKNHDYSTAGAYFVTLCVKDMHEVLSKIAPVGARIARPSLSKAGGIVETAIENIPHIYQNVHVDKYVIMPNHIHMIIVIEENGRAMRAPTVSRIINQMKGYTTKQLSYSIWQKLFHDHIIRTEKDYLRIAQYIDENPARWQEDCYFIHK